MKKIYGVLLVILLTSVMTGCSSNSNKELCENIDKIQVLDYTEAENYNELGSLLQSNYDKYCNEINSNVCKSLEKYIESTKEELDLEDCSTKQDSSKEICESDNKIKVLDKKNNVNYNHEEVWAACNEK